MLWQEVDEGKTMVRSVTPQIQNIVSDRLREECYYDSYIVMREQFNHSGEVTVKGFCSGQPFNPHLLSARLIGYQVTEIVVL